MLDRITKIKGKLDKFIPIHTKSGVWSMCISTCIGLLCAMICYYLFYNGIQPYHDIVVGNITMPGIFKNVDFYAYYTFTIVYFISFFWFNGVYNKKYNDYDERITPFSMISIMVGILPCALIILFKMGSFPIFKLCFIVFLVAILVSVIKAKTSLENVEKLVLSCFYVYLSSAGVFALCSYFAPTIADKGTRYFIPLLWLLLAVMSCIIYLLVNGKLKVNQDIFADRVSSITQLIIPLSLFSIINTRYIYLGSIVSVMNYERFRNITIFIIIAMLSINVIFFLKRIYLKRIGSSVNITTLISFVSVALWNTGYNLVINTDQFHTGETAIVWQQIIELRQQWGREFVSVLQGLGFSISALNEVVFGGTYATYTQAQNLLLVIAAVLTTIALYFVIKHKWMLLIVTPVMPVFLMNRTYLLALVFIFLLNPSIIKSPIRWTYAYTLTCIVGVWYQPTYGGGVALALLPVLGFMWYRSYKDKQIFNFKDKKTLFKMSSFVISIFIIGISCIPMLVNAILFLKVNGYETMIGNGIGAMQNIKYVTYLTGYKMLDATILLLYKFGSGILACMVMLYFFVMYVIKQKDYVKLVQGIMLTLSTTISFFILLPASFTRIDNGLSRIGFTSVIYFGCLLLLLFYLYRNDIRNKSAAVIFCGIIFSASFYITYPPYLQIHEKANSIVYIPDDVVYVKPEETGLENLGFAYIQDTQYLNEAMILNEMCRYLLNDSQTYYDFTDKSIYYLYTNKKVPGLYVANMIAANEPIQNEVIESLKKRDVPLVYINKPLRYMGVNEPLRSYRIYRYFMMQDYSFVRYKGCDFLVRNDIDLSPIADCMETIDMATQVGIVDNQIDIAAYENSLLEKLSLNNQTVFNNIENINNKMKIIGEDPFIIMKPKNNIDFSDIQLIEIKLKNKLPKGMRGQLFITTEYVDHNEINTIRFEIQENRVLIPLYKLSQFALNGKLIDVRLDFDSINNGQEATVESINLYRLDETQKMNLEEQYAQLAKSLTSKSLNDAFHQPYLAYLPLEWGANFKRLAFRFSPTEKAISGICNQKSYFLNDSISVVDEPVTVNLQLEKPVQGIDGEFLKLKLNYSDKKEQNVALIVNGIDKENTPFTEEFMFVSKDSDLLIPIGSAPICLQAKSIESIDIVFEMKKEPYSVSIEQVQLYKLEK